jgi:hypothetical protein
VGQLLPLTFLSRILGKLDYKLRRKGGVFVGYNATLIKRLSDEIKLQ